MPDIHKQFTEQRIRKATLNRKRKMIRHLYIKNYFKKMGFELGYCSHGWFLGVSSREILILRRLCHPKFRISNLV